MNGSCLFLTLCLWLSAATAAAFSSPSPSSGSPGGVTLFDRFRATCPAHAASIHQFDPSLSSDASAGGDECWVAVYRSTNNMPSVFMRDEFLNAMQIATTVQGTTTSSSSLIETSTTSSSFSSPGDSADGKDDAQQRTTPVAVARLRPAADVDDEVGWVIDSMRCSLKKEDTSDDCDGGSEHAEALSVCIDELLLEHLRKGRRFDGAIRCKATLVSGRLLEDRGFREVMELSRDMATHVSDLDKSTARYADRAVSRGAAKNPGARDRALQILSFLGRLDRHEERRASAVAEADKKKNYGDEEDDEYDPWANVKRFL